MRIVMIGPFGMRPRGTMRARSLPMAQALAARGHGVKILLPPWQNPEDAGHCWEEDGVLVENIPLPPGVPGLFHLLTAGRLARRALAWRPDVIHLVKPKAYSGLAHWLIARLPRRLRPRLVVDGDDWEGPGGWNRIGDYSPLQRRFFTWQERWGYAHADVITVASRALQTLVWAMDVPPERVFYIPNGLLNARRWRAGTGPERSEPRVQDPVILLFTAFFEYPMSRVFDVLARVQRSVPAARLVVVGKGVFDEEKSLPAMAREAGLGGAVEYAGFVDHDELPVLFSQAAVAIQPFDDTLVNRTKCSVKLCELLAAGVPVVAEAVGENQEMIRHGETGWLVDSGDVIAFAEAVTRLLQDAPLRDRLGRAAARDVATRLTWDRLAEDVERAYTYALEST